jgi:hypothetical protein
MCPRDNKLYREMTSSYSNGQYCVPLTQYCCTCFNATRLPLYWAPLYFSRAVKKYLGDSVFTAWPWRWRQRNCGNFKSRKSYLCHRFYDLWISTSTLFLAETSNCNIHRHNNNKSSRNANGYLAGVQRNSLSVPAIHVVCKIICRFEQILMAVSSESGAYCASTPRLSSYFGTCCQHNHRNFHADKTCTRLAKPDGKMYLWRQRSW